MIVLRRCSTAPRLSGLQRRLDRIALNQLRSVASELHEENERLRSELSLAESNCDFWWQQAIDLQQELAGMTGGKPGITVDGHLVITDTGAQA